MELRQLKYFISVANHGSFTAAAEELHVSQPALGTQVKKLEEELNVNLFDRNFHGVELTQAGSRFLSHAKDILEKIDFASHDISEFQGKVEGVVGEFIGRKYPKFTQTQYGCSDVEREPR